MHLSLFLASNLIVSTAHAHPGGHDGYYAPTAPPAPAPAATEIPAYYGDIIDVLKEQATAAAKALDAQKIADIHRIVREMTDLSAAMAAKATGLSTESQATVATKATSLKSQLDALVLAADKGNMTNGKAALAAIQADLVTLAALR